MNNINKLTYGAVLGAISIVLIIIANYLSSPDSIMYFIASIPIAIYSYKYKFIDSIILGISIFILALIITNFLNAILITMPIVLIGIILGTSLRKNYNIYLTLIITIIISILFDVIITYFFANVYGIDILNEIKAMLEWILEFTSITGVDVNMLSQVILALVLLVFGITKVLFIYILFKFMLKRLKSYKDENTISE